MVILEPTNVPELLELISPGISSGLAGPEQNRFFKARDWVNRWDTEGAKAVREIFAWQWFPPQRPRIWFPSSLTVAEVRELAKMPELLQ
jgi:hypothetical protein